MEKGHTLELPPHGYVRYVDHFGSDTRIVEAARVSYGAASKGEEQDHKLLDYLYKQRHSSPFEQCSITFNIKMPIFVQRQFVRHRTLRMNEFSARYKELPDECYLPESWRAQATVNKQGSVESEAIDQVHCTLVAETAYKQCMEAYRELLALGVAKEQARFVIPVAVYTEIYVNVDIHNLLHLLRLRMDPHAQKEIRDVAEAMCEIATELFPWTFEAFRKYKWKLEDNTL